MSEEAKPTDKQLLLAEHKKANDALGLIKKHTKHVDAYVSNDEGGHSEILYLYRHHTDFSMLLETLSTYLRIQFERIMKSNNKKQTSTFKPIRTKHLDTNKEPKMAAKKATKKPAKKVSKKTTAKKTATKRK